MRSDYRSQKSGFFAVATPPQQWHRFHCVSIYKRKYADSLCQIRQQILKFSPRNLMICLKRDQITCFEGMLFHSKMTYIRMTRQYSKKKEEGAVTAIKLVILGHRKTEGLYLVWTKIILQDVSHNFYLPKYDYHLNSEA